MTKPGNPLLTGGDFAPLKEAPWIRSQREALRNRAEEYLKTQTPALSYSLFRLYWETGDRSRYQKAYFDRRGRLLAFSLTAWLEPENPLWLAAAEDILWEICAEPFWCIPAHFLAEDDSPLPFERYAGQLDLFSCETGFAIAECLELLGDRLAPDVVRQADLQLNKRIFDRFLDNTVFYRFEGMSNNWSAVCGGAVGSAALYRLRDAKKLAAILHRCLSCLDVYLDSFGADGVCVEGVNYWTYGFGFAVCFAELLARRTQGTVDMFNDEKMKAIAVCQQYYFLAGNRTISFADGSDSARYRMGLSCFLQRRFGAPMPQPEYAAPVLEDDCYRYCLALRDFLWYDPNARFGLDHGAEVWLKDAQWFLSGGGTLRLAAKAGNNGESHNHNDCGSFVLCKDGELLLCDLGAGLYDAETFGPRRYEFFINASRSHNVPLVGGVEQSPGAAAATRNVTASFADSPEGCNSLSMNLTACYPLPELLSLRRRIVQSKSSGRVTLEDSACFSSPQSITEVFLSKTPIVLSPGMATFSCNGKNLRLSFDESQFCASLPQESYVDHEGAAQTAYLLHLTSRTLQMEFDCTINLE